MSAPNLSQFRDFELIGKGGGADVYRAVRVSTGGEVAVKAFLATLDPATVVRRANREVGALVSLKGHPNVVQIEEVLQVDDAVYVVMEYAPGGSLADRIRTAGPLGAEEVLTVGSQIASALAAAHDKGILHRDVKPHNVLFGQFGAAKLCDFGIAAIAAEGQASRTSAISIRYASPEELDGAPLTAATDVYSLGATLLHSFVGRPADLNERLGGIEPLVAEAPLALRSAIVGSMQLDPVLRPSAAQMQAILSSRESGAGSATGASTSTGRAAVTGEAARATSARVPVEASAADAFTVHPAGAGGGAGAGVGSTPEVPTPNRTDVQRAIGGATVSVIFDRPDEPSTPVLQRPPWWRRPGAYVAFAMAAVVLAVVALVVGRSGDGGADASASIAADGTMMSEPVDGGAGSGPVATEAVEGTRVSTVAPGSTTAPMTPPVSTPETTVAIASPPANPYGDRVGETADGSSGPAAAFVVALQQRGAAGAVAANLSPAYYYALAHQLGGRVSDPTLLPVATEAGYVVRTDAGAVELRDFVFDGAGLVVDAVEVRGAGSMRLADAAPSTGVCIIDRDPTCDFTRNDAVRDEQGSGSAAWVLARVISDATRRTLIVFVDAGGPTVQSAASDGLPIAVDPSGLIALDVPGSAEPGAVVSLSIVLSDGRALTYSVPVG